MDFKLGELFCGPGGLSLGAMQSSLEHSPFSFSIKHAWANDFDRDSCETYRRNISPDSPRNVICRDVRDLDFSTLGEIDALAFGFPCNDFSVVGEHKGIDGVYGPLYSYGIRAMEWFKPKWFLAENVGGLRSANDGSAFQTILSEMQESGYTLTPHLYRFEEYGVPQARHRIIIIGIRSDLEVEFKVPAPMPGYRRTSKEAIEDPPIPVDASNHERTKQAQHVIERLNYIKPGENAFTADLPEHLKINVKGAKISQIYKRLDPHKPAYTVTGSGGGGTHMYHWEESRALTNRERARLQTFPDHFVFHGSKESVRRQVGMALPPLGAQQIFEAVLKCFAGVDYPWVQPNMTIRGQMRSGSRKQLRLLEKQSDYRVTI